MPQTRLRVVKPTRQTPFHSDFDWWKNHGRSWKVFLKSYLPEEVQEGLDRGGDGTMIDIIDPETAEVHQVETGELLSAARNAAGGQHSDEGQRDGARAQFSPFQVRPLSRVWPKAGLREPAPKGPGTTSRAGPSTHEGAAGDSTVPLCRR